MHRAICPQLRFVMLRVSLALALSAALSAGQGSSKRFIAPTDATVRTMLEEGINSPSQLIYVENLSTVEIIVYSLTLRDCDNVRQSCAPMRLNARVPPGRRVMIRRVEPRNQNAGFGFRYTFGWRADSSDVEALRLMAEGGSSVAREQLAAREEGVAERRAAVGAQDEVLDQQALITLGSRIARLRVEPDSVVMVVGQMFLTRQVRIMALDSLGGLLGRVFAYNWRVSQGLVSVRSDTVVAMQPGRGAAEFLLMPPVNALSARLPIIVVPDTSANSVRAPGPVRQR